MTNEKRFRLFASLAVMTAVLLALLWPRTELEAQQNQPFNAFRVTVATTATLIYTGTQRGAKIRLCNRHTTPIFVGPAGVTTANGFEIINATCEDIDPAPRSAVFGIVAAATARVDVFEHQYNPRGQ